MNAMFDAVYAFPDHLLEAHKLCARFSPPQLKANKVAVLGMGGSAIGGDLLKAMAEKLSALPVFVIRNEEIPNYVDEHTLVLVVSYSGNTQETLLALRAALYKSQGKVVAVSTGGSLKEEALKKIFPCLEIPGGFMPRAALAYTFVPLLDILQKIAGLPDQSLALKESADLLRGMREDLAPSRAEERNPAVLLAKALGSRIPVVYASTPFFAPAARRWKCQVNENAKQPAYFGVFPEVTHNEMVGFSQPHPAHRQMACVFLRDVEEPLPVTTRVEFMKARILECGCPVHDVLARGESFLARLLSLCFFGDYVSLYLARENQVDPTPIPIIEALKEKLKR